MNVSAALNLPTLASRAQVARALGVCTKTLQRAELRGQIKPIREGRSVLYPIVEVAKYVASQLN
jgi:hypothetical protein